MKTNFKNAVIAFLSIAILALYTLPANAGLPSESHDANAIWIEPASVDLTTATVGYKFNITVAVNISTTEEIGAWQARINFNPTYVKAVRVGLTEGTKSNWFSGFSCFAADPLINNETGYVLHGETILGAAVLSPGAGTLFWIEFQVDAIPPSDLTFTLNLPQTYVLDENEAEISITKYNGTGIIPEFSSLMILLLFMVITFATLILAQKKTRKLNLAKQ